MGGRKDYEQKKGTRKRQVLSMMKGIHGRRGHLGKQGEFEEHDGIG